jgi:hypothetical protein
LPGRRSSVMATVKAVAAVVPVPAPAPAKQAATTPSLKLAGAGGRCLPVSQTMARIKAQGKVCSTSACLISVGAARILNVLAQLVIYCVCDGGRRRSSRTSPPATPTWRRRRRRCGYSMPVVPTSSSLACPSPTPTPTGLSSRIRWLER